MYKIQNTGMEDVIQTPALTFIISHVAAFSFIDLCRVRRVNAAFWQAVELVLHEEFAITAADVRQNHHVAALRYAARVATGARVVLAAGNYRLEANYDDTGEVWVPPDQPLNPYVFQQIDAGEGHFEADDVDRSGRPDMIREDWCLGYDGVRFDKVPPWKPGKGSLVVEANNISIVSEERHNAVVTFSKDIAVEDDPLVHVAIVVKAKGVQLGALRTTGGLSIFVDEGASVAANDCDFGGTATVLGSGSLCACAIREGQYGGVNVVAKGELRMAKCKMIGNELCGLGSTVCEGVTLSGKGRAHIEETHSWMHEDHYGGGYDETEKMYRAPLLLDERSCLTYEERHVVFGTSWSNMVEKGKQGRNGNTNPYLCPKSLGE